MESRQVIVLSILAALFVSDQCGVTTSLSTTPFFPYGDHEGDEELPKDDDSRDASRKVCLSNSRFAINDEMCLYVNINGIISSEPFSEYKLKSLTNFRETLLAAFWTDLITKRSDGGSGNVYYRNTSEQSILDDADRRIQKVYRSGVPFRTKEVLIVTWYQTASFFKNYDSMDRSHLKDRVSTFQCVVAAGDYEMFIIYLYKQLLHSTVGSKKSGKEALVGYISADHTIIEEHSSSLTNSVVNLAETSNCNVPGQWIFRVQDFACPEPNFDSNAYVHFKRDIGATAKYVCHTGYVLKGVTERKCEKGESREGVWSGEAPTCEAIVCSSPNPPNGPMNGSVQYTTGPPYKYGTVANYTCDRGYYRVGPAIRTCVEGVGGVEGKWDGQEITCQPVSCEPLDIPNGSINFSTKINDESKLSFGTVATHSCNDGYSLVGLSERTCEGEVNGTWSGQAPTCEPITCLPLNISNGSIEYSLNQSGESRLKFGTVATHSCKSGFSLLGDDSRRTCEGEVNGTWSAQTLTCEPITCLPLNIANGSIEYSLNQSVESRLKFGTVATHSCNEGYSLVANDSKRTCEGEVNGIWSGRTLTCGPITCPPLNIGNGSIEYSLNQSGESRLKFGTIATHSCNKGYSLVADDSKRTCEGEFNGTWSGQTLTCEPITCLPLNIGNGSIEYSLNQSGEYRLKFGTVATHSCKPGFSLAGGSEIKRKCEGERIQGKWSGTELSCEPVTCFSLSILNGYVDYSSNQTGQSNLSFGTVANVSCQEGFSLIVDPTITCGKGDGVNGKWSNDIPSCEPVTCFPLDNIAYSRSLKYSTEINGESKLSFGTNATYSCEVGFFLLGESERTCSQGLKGVEGEWSGQVPSCEPVVCSPLEKIINGQIQYSTEINDESKLSFGTVATHSCNEGFTLVRDNSKRTCEGEVNGTWSGQAPTCERIKCSPLDNIENGFVLYDKSVYQSLYDFNTTASYKCLIGCNAVNVTRRCVGDHGEWSDEAPTCECSSIFERKNGSSLFYFGVVMKGEITAEGAVIQYFENGQQKDDVGLGVRVKIEKDSVPQNRTLGITIRVTVPQPTNMVGGPDIRYMSAVSSFEKNTNVELIKPITPEIEHNYRFTKDDAKDLDFYAFTSKEENGKTVLQFLEKLGGDFTFDSSGKPVGNVALSDYYINLNVHIVIGTEDKTGNDLYSERVYWSDNFEELGYVVFCMCPDLEYMFEIIDRKVAREFSISAAMSNREEAEVTFDDGYDLIELKFAEVPEFDFDYKQPAVIKRKVVDRLNQALPPETFDNQNESFNLPRIVFRISPKSGQLPNYSTIFRLNTSNVTPESTFPIRLSKSKPKNDAERICPTDYCSNGGKCHILTNLSDSSQTPSCECPSGFFGPMCQQKPAKQSESKAEIPYALVIGMSGLIIGLLVGFVTALMTVPVVLGHICPPQGRDRRIVPTTSLNALKTDLNVPDLFLDKEIDGIDASILGGFFDTVELYPDLMGLQAGEPAKLRTSFVLHGPQVAMAECLNKWRGREPGKATFRELLNILLQLGKRDIAVQVCEYVKKEAQPPSIKNEVLQSKRVRKGDHVSFTVLTEGPYLTYQWMKGNLSLQDGQHHFQRVTTPILSITSASLQHEGEYYCVISNRRGVQAKSQPQSLTVGEAPSLANDEQQIKEVKTGSRLSLSVEASGTELTYHWLIGDTPLNEESQFHGVTSSCLTITEVAEHNSGDYTCVIRNEWGSVISSLFKVIVGTPTPPRSPKHHRCVQLECEPSQIGTPSPPRSPKHHRYVQLECECGNCSLSDFFQ